MANEVRMTSVGTLPADDSADFAIKVVDQDGAVQATALTVDQETGELTLGVGQAAQTVTPDDSEGAGVNVINPGVTSVSVGANVNGTDDFIVLPALADVPAGHTVTVVSNAAGHEVRTPADSDEEINSENCDGTKEYAIASGGQIHRFTKIDDTIGWMGQGFTAIGAVVTAVVPD